MAFLGKNRCQCINTTNILASLPERGCQLLPSGDPGIRLTIDGSCVPFSYGSSQCLKHDLLHEAKCQVDPTGEDTILSYCFRPWCFVDFETCRKESDVRAFRSSYFPSESNVNLFYSYSTCNSTAEDWFDVEDDVIGNKKALGGISIAANVPTYQLPMMYKRDVDDEILPSTGPEYYNDSIPFEGVYLKYVDQIKEISNGDIRSVIVTHRTKASSIVHPTSSFTAAVQDINDGLVDMGIGPFWITAQRLKLSSFTTPVVNDRTLLVIPATKDVTFGHEAKQVMLPFTVVLWVIVLGIIVFASVLSLWFNLKNSTSEQNRLRNNNGRRNQRPQGTSWRRSKGVHCRLFLDEFLEKGLFFCSAGVEQDKNSSLPVKLLLFGFGFFILIAVSAYVANLAAFLVMSDTSADARTMKEAIEKGVQICAHPALKNEMENDWPDAKFYFHENAREFPGMLEDYDDDKCEVMAVGHEDTSMDTKFLQGLCERGLVYTNEIIVEIPIAFPIRSSIGPGFSYWMKQGDVRHGVDLQAAKDKFPQKKLCNVQYKGGTTEGNEPARISEMNMSFPIMIFLSFSVMAVIVQLVHLRGVKQGSASLVGRRSTLQLQCIDDSHKGEEQGDDLGEEEKVDETGIKRPRVKFCTINNNNAESMCSSKLNELREFTFDD